MMGTVYLLHFDKPVGEPQSDEARAQYGLGPRKSNHCTCQHYIGWASQFKRRIEHHRNGNGARLTAIAAQQGIDFTVARIWKDKDKAFERRLKNYKKARALCPICSGKIALNRMPGKPEEDEPCKINS